MSNWYKKTYVCSGCDALYEIQTKSEALTDQNCLECKEALTLIMTSEVIK